MFFLYEPVLYALCLPLLFFVLSFRAGKNTMKKIFVSSVLAQLSVRKDKLEAPGRYRIFLLALSLFILSLARPVMDEKNISREQMLIPVVIALDVSKSMHIKDIYPDRLSFAKQKLEKLISKSLNMRIGIVFFDSSAYMAYPVSEDTDAVAYMLEHLDKKQKFEGGSNIFSALEAAVYMLRSFPAKNIILLSDGGNSGDVSKEIAYTKENALRVYAIGMASDTGGYLSDDENSLSVLNPTLKRLAIESGGRYEGFSWGGHDIDTIVSQIKKDSFKEVNRRYPFKEYTELFAYPLALGVLLLFFAFYSFARLNQEKTVLVWLVASGLLFTQTKLQAGVLDFVTLYQAKQLYKEEKYANSAELYQSVVSNKEGYYNLANALYQANRYKEAISAYQKSLSESKTMNAKALHNMGNCYVQLEALESAKRSYERALDQVQNPLTKENLNWVDMALLEEKKKKDIKKKKQGKKKARKKKRKRECKKAGRDKKGQNISSSKIELEPPEHSSYEVELKNLRLSQEQHWMKLLQKQQAPSFLQKLKTQRMSQNVQDDR